MENKIKCIIAVITGIMMYSQVEAQKDTVYIYEDIIIYETIVLYDTVFAKPTSNTISPINYNSINLRPIEPKKADLFFNSGQQTATFPDNYIILNENNYNVIKNSESMKKLSFLGIAIFAVHSLVMAQTDYEITFGSGIWWQSGKLEYVDKPYSPLFNVGLFAERNFPNSNFGAKAGLEYNYLLGSNNYLYDGTPGVWHSKDGYEFESINSKYGAGLHNITFPFLFYYQKNRIQPYLGLNYNYLASGFQHSSSGTTYYSGSHNFGLNIGTGIKLHEIISINIEFKHNLTNDFGADILGPVGASAVMSSSYSLRNSQSKISLVYAFKRKS
jgi:hypothetical protein